VSGAPREVGLRNSPASGNSNGYLRANGSLPRNKCALCARRWQACPYWHTGQGTVPVRCAPDTQAGPQVRSSNGQNPTAVMMWQGTPDCPVCTGLSGATPEQRLSSRQRLSAAHLMRALRAQMAGTPMLAHQTANSTCPVCTGHPGGPTSQKLQRSESNGSDDVAGGTGLSGAPSNRQPNQRSSLVVGATNTPTTPPFIASKFSTSQLLQEL
jgi:hypothetical protein